MKGMTDNNGIAKTEPMATEVKARPARRVFPPEYKRKIVDEVNAAPHGGIAIILRREGLYSTTVENWRKELAASMEPRKRGRKPSPDTPLKKELERLQRENQRLTRKLEHAELIIDVQKKVARLLGDPPIELPGEV